MLNSVTRAPMLFFDSNPLGRIFNRFSKDTAVSDGTLPEQAYIFSGVSLLSYVLDLLAVSHVHHNVDHGLPLPLCSDCGGACGHVLRPSEVLGGHDGLPSVRCHHSLSHELDVLSQSQRAHHNQANHFEQKFHSLVDHNGCAFFSYIASTRWMGYYLDYFSLFYILCTLGFAYLLRSEGINTALVALGVTSSISLLGPLQFLIRTSANVANSMTSIQRMQEYSSLESEPPARLDGDAEL